MRLPCALLVAGLATMCAGAGDDPAWGPEEKAAALERYRAVDAFYRGHGTVAPPAWWRVRRREDVKDARGEVVTLDGKDASNMHGIHKNVKVARIRVDGADADVVVKWQTDNGAKKDVFGEFYTELLYLEHMRGQPGVPELHGAWYVGERRNAPHYAYVVADCGAPVAFAAGGPEYALPAAYFDAAYANPLAVARSWFRLGRSFAERGGYVLGDFQPQQFTILDGEIFLVDAPDAHEGPAADAYRSLNAKAHAARFPADNASYATRDSEPEKGRPSTWVIRSRSEHPRFETPKGGAPSSEDDPKRAETDRERRLHKGEKRSRPRCGSDSERRRCPTAPKSYHCCCDVVDRRGKIHRGGKRCTKSRGAPEAKALGRCGADGKCPTLSAKTHVFDFANRNWILDHVAALAPEAEAALLRRLKAVMSAPDPDDRPTFSELLERLDQGARDIAASWGPAVT